MNLGDYLSNEDKKSLYLPKGIVVGTVIRAFVEFTNPPKEKRFIVVGFHEDKINLTSVLINTEINFNVNNTPELSNEHIEFNCKDRPYLAHDSFIDCTEIHSIEIGYLSEIIDSNPDVVIGAVEKNDMDKIISQIANSEIIKGKIKRRCGIFDYKFDE